MLEGPSDAMHQELENVNTHVEVDDYELKLPNGHEDKPADDPTKSKMLCEGTAIDTEIHENEIEVKNPLLGHAEENIEKLTALEDKASELLTKNNKSKKDSMIDKNQEKHNDHIMAVDEEKKKKRKRPEHFEGKIALKFKDQNKLKLIIVQATIENESFYIFNNVYETRIKFKLLLMMQRNTKVLAWVLIVQPTIKHDVTFSFICKRTLYVWLHYEVNKMPDCFQTQSEQYSLKKAITTSGENSDLSAICDLNSEDVTTMKNTQHDKMLTQKHGYTGQHTMTIKGIKAISSHISLKDNVNKKILARPALNSQYSKEPLKSKKELCIFMQSSNGKESLCAKYWHLNSVSDHLFFNCSDGHDLYAYAVRFGAEGIPPRPHIHLPEPALPLTRFLAHFNTAGPNFTASSAQEQSPNQSRETENISFSSRVLADEFPSAISVDERNGLSLRPSNDDQIEATSSETTASQWNVDTNNSGSDETIPKVYFQVEESAELEENNTFPKLDTPSQQIAEAGSDLSDSLDKNSLNYTAITEGANSMASTCNNVGEALASTPGSGKIQKYLLTAAAQSVINMGYKPKVVLLAIRRLLMNRVSEEITVQMILETVWQIEEEKKNTYPALPSSVRPRK